jgi:hypothetical protein
LIKRKQRTRQEDVVVQQPRQPHIQAPVVGNHAGAEVQAAQPFPPGLAVRASAAAAGSGNRSRGGAATATVYVIQEGVRRGQVAVGDDDVGGQTLPGGERDAGHGAAARVDGRDLRAGTEGRAAGRRSRPEPLLDLHQWNREPIDGY